MLPKIKQQLAQCWLDLRSAEGQATLLFAIRLFLILFAYYLMKPVREELVLASGSALVRSYALTGQAAILLMIVPFYSRVIRHVHGDRLFQVVTLFLISNIVLFYVLGQMGLNIGVMFFVWLGIFSVLQVSQFWTLVSDYHGVEKGTRLTSYIAIGGSSGAMIGSMVAKGLYHELGAYGLMIVAMGMLLVAVVMPRSKDQLRDDHHDEQADDTIEHLLGGLKKVVALPYLRWIAASVVMLNLINSTGEFVLADFVVAEKSGEQIGEFYSTFYLFVNIATLLLQAFLVRPLYRWIGVGGTLISLAAINLVMYFSVLAWPVLAWFAIVKVADNSIDYSVANTTKQILFLPLDRFTRYEGMLAVNTFFTRFGDLIQGGLIFLVMSVLAKSTTFLVGVNVSLCLIWLLITFRLSREFQTKTEQLNS